PGGNEFSATGSLPTRHRWNGVSVVQFASANDPGGERGVTAAAGRDRAQRAYRACLGSPEAGAAGSAPPAPAERAERRRAAARGHRARAGEPSLDSVRGRTNRKPRHRQRRADSVAAAGNSDLHGHDGRDGDPRAAPRGAFRQPNRPVIGRPHRLKRSGGMKGRDLTELAVRNLREAALRNSLTTLGVAVGVASLVAMLSLGVGLQALASQKLNKSGLFDAVFVTARRPRGMGGPERAKPAGEKREPVR